MQQRHDATECLRHQLMETTLQHFTMGHYLLRLCTSGELVLPPYKGSTLRGAFGHSFKRAVCSVGNTACEQCLLRTACHYAYAFLSPPPPGATMMRKYPRTPHPFVIEPPLEKKEVYSVGESLFFQLLLIGKAIDHLPYFVYAFKEMGRHGIGRGRTLCELKEVYAFDATGKQHLAYSSEDDVLRTKLPRIHYSELPEMTTNGQMRLSFLTPTRIKHRGRYTRQPAFDALISSLLRRISALSYFHCGQELQLDFRGLVEQAKRVSIAGAKLEWHDWQRYSSSQNTRMKLGGVVGEIEYSGDLEVFAPLVRLGEKVHVGKGTTFGLGKYTLLIP